MEIMCWHRGLFWHQPFENWRTRFIKIFRRLNKLFKFKLRLVYCSQLLILFIFFRPYYITEIISCSSTNPIAVNIWIDFEWRYSSLFDSLFNSLINTMLFGSWKSWSTLQKCWVRVMVRWNSWSSRSIHC